MLFVCSMHVLKRYVRCMVRNVRSQEENSATRATTKPGSTELLHTECWLHLIVLNFYYLFYYPLLNCKNSNSTSSPSPVLHKNK